MKISIITVAYNSSATIRNTIESVISQHYSNYEYIIVDGNSTDGTQEIIQSYTHPNIKWVSEPDKGLYDAMNKGLKMATGDIIGILNSDDFYLNPSVLNKVAAAFRKEKVDSLYSDLAYVDPVDTSKVVRYWKSGNYKEGSFLQGWMPPHPTFFVKRTVYEQYKAFDLRLKSAADYELMLRFIHRHKISVAYIPEILVMMRAGGKSNKNFLNRFKANREDRLAWEYNQMAPTPFTLLLKPLRKLEQFLFLSYKQRIIHQLNTYTPQLDLKPRMAATN